MAVAYKDGRFVDRSGINFSIDDFGLSRGIAVYCLARVYDGVPFRLQDHLESFRQGAEALGLNIATDDDALISIIQSLCEENNLEHSLVKMYLTAGEPGKFVQSFAADHAFNSHLVIIEDEFKPAHPQAPYGIDAYKRGKRLKTVLYERQIPEVKSTNYLTGYYASREAGREWDDVLYADREGNVTEATRSNFFCVVDGVLCTAGEGIFPGVTRKVMIELARDLGIPVEVRKITHADIGNASEAFLTGSASEMTPICRVDDHIFLTTMQGEVFSKLRNAFSECIAKECYQSSDDPIALAG